MLDNEKPAKLVLWMMNGSVFDCEPPNHADIKVSVGRTNSKEALGFVVTNGEDRMMFVLDKYQVAELAAYCLIQLKRLKKRRGPKPVMMCVDILERKKAKDQK